jgi:hypothetical protein
MNVLGLVVFVGMVVAIWLSYRLFVRGDTPKERVSALMPPGFNADVSYRKGDTYVGYEKEKDRLVLVDWPHAKVLSPADVRALEPLQESTLGVTHYWIGVDVPDPAFPQYRIWFQFRRAPRDMWLSRLAEICKNASAVGAGPVARRGA